MKSIDFGLEIKDLNGKVLTSGPEKLIMATVVANSLVVTPPINPQRDAIRQYQLALKINATKGVMEVEDADVALIKEVLGKNAAQYTTLVLAQVLQEVGK